MQRSYCSQIKLLESFSQFFHNLLNLKDINSIKIILMIIVPIMVMATATITITITITISISV